LYVQGLEAAVLGGSIHANSDASAAVFIIRERPERLDPIGAQPTAVMAHCLLAARAAADNFPGRDEIGNWGSFHEACTREPSGGKLKSDAEFMYTIYSTQGCNTPASRERRRGGLKPMFSMVVGRERRAALGRGASGP
jgi:hypothetical protein